MDDPDLADRCLRCQCPIEFDIGDACHPPGRSGSFPRHIFHKRTLARRQKTDQAKLARWLTNSAGSP